MITLVRRDTDNTVFEIDPKTLDAITCSFYDAYCYSYPERRVTYIEYSDWIAMRNDQQKNTH